MENHSIKNIPDNTHDKIHDNICNISNLEINKKENTVIVSVNPKIYPLDVIYSAAYVFLDKAYILLDGDPEEEVIVELKPKQEIELEILGREFNNELLNYVNYKKLSEKNAIIRQLIIQRALFNNTITKDSNTEDSDYLKDSEQIAKPWGNKQPQ